MIVCTNLMAIHPIAVEIFKDQSDGPTEPSISWTEFSILEPHRKDGSKAKDI